MLRMRPGTPATLSDLQASIVVGFTGSSLNTSHIPSFKQADTTVANEKQECDLHSNFAHCKFVDGNDSFAYM